MKIKKLDSGFVIEENGFVTYGWTSGKTSVTTFTDSALVLEVGELANKTFSRAIWEERKTKSGDIVFRRHTSKDNALRKLNRFGQPKKQFYRQWFFYGQVLQTTKESND